MSSSKVLASPFAPETPAFGVAASSSMRARCPRLYTPWSRRAVLSLRQVLLYLATPPSVSLCLLCSCLPWWMQCPLSPAHMCDVAGVV